LADGEIERTQREASKPASLPARPVRGSVDGDMIFRLWFYWCKLLTPCVLLGLVAGWVLGDSTAGLVVRRATLTVFVVSGMAGGVLGFAIFVLGLKLGCPRCGRPGYAGGHKSTFQFCCEQCGALSANLFSDSEFRVDQAEPKDEGQNPS